MKHRKKSKQTVVTQYKWAGSWGPFKIKSKHSECDLTTTLLKKMIQEEFKKGEISFEVKPWLDNIFYCLIRNTWQAPAIMVNGKKFFQFSHKFPLFDRQKLVHLVKKLNT